MQTRTHPPSKNVYIFKDYYSEIPTTNRKKKYEKTGAIFQGEVGGGNSEKSCGFLIG